MALKVNLIINYDSPLQLSVAVGFVACIQIGCYPFLQSCICISVVLTPFF